MSDSAASTLTAIRNNIRKQQREEISKLLQSKKMPCVSSCNSINELIQTYDIKGEELTRIQMAVNITLQNALMK